MWSANFFQCVLTLALALPLTQSVLFAYEIWSGDQAAQKIAIQIPTTLPGWQIMKDSDDVEDRDLIRRFFRDKDGDVLIVTARQTSAYRIHDLIDCARAAGMHPETVADSSIKMSGGTPPLHASFIRTAKDGKVRLGINWFQNGSLTTGSQRGWKLLLVQNGAKMCPPLCKQVYIVIRGQPDSKKAMLLSEAARNIYTSQQ